MKRMPIPGALTAVAASVLLLSACAGFQETESAVKLVGAVTLPPFASAADASAWPREDWWAGFHDEQLDRLMVAALRDSPSLALAQTRIARAQAALGQAHAATLPQATGNVDVSYGRQSENYIIPPPPIGPGGETITQGRAAVDFSYDLDFWGKNAALVRAARAQVDAGRYDRDAARLALTTGIARAYAQLASQHDLLDVLDATRTQRREVRELTGQRVRIGLDTRIDEKQAEASEAALSAEIAQLAASIDVTRLQLAALAGEMPDAAMKITRPSLQSLQVKAPASLPLDLLGRRPELAAQRARIEAATGEIESARAQFYPNIDLTGFAGFQAIGLGALLKPGSVVTGIGPALHLPLFDGGRLRANYAAKRADADAAVAQYNQSVLDAARDVAEQLTRIAALDGEEKANAAALAASEEAYRLAMLRYKGGLSPYLTVLTTQAPLLVQRRAASELRARRQDLQINLIRALGGGFQEAAAGAVAQR